MGLKIKNKGKKEGELYLFDEIGGDMFGGVSLGDVAAGLNQLKGEGVTDITLRINSPGGDMFEGIAIYNMLRKSKLKITTSIEGLAASAASIIALAGDVVTMSDSAFFMIHNSHTVAAGDTRSFKEVSDQLAEFDEQLARIYLNKIGGEVSVIKAAMDAETWYNATDAQAAGFIDQVNEALPVAAYCDKKKFKHAPAALTPIIRNDQERAKAIAKRAKAAILRLSN